MQTVKYVKSFSKGQITIPKDIREEIGVENDFWLKLSIHNGKIIAEPVETGENKTSWRKKLLQIGSISFDAQELKKNREQVEKQIKIRSI